MGLGRDARILVVDDNPDVAEGIAMLLAETQLDVRLAHSARRALALMEEGEFDLVLSDLRMPELSGLDLLKTIRAQWPKTKVVLVTADGSIDSAVDAMRSGASDYLIKPFNSDRLLDLVRRLVVGTAGSFDFDTAAVVGDVAAAVSADHLLPGLKRALGVLVEATGADDGEIFLCEPSGQDALLCVWAGPDGDALTARTRFERGVGYPGIVAATQQPLCTNGGLDNDRRYLRRGVTEAGMQTVVAAPLPDAHGVLGSVHLLSRRGDLPVERVLELLERAAIPISTAIRAGLAALRQSIDAVGGPLDDPSGHPLQLSLESIRRVAGARHGTLAVVDPQTGRPRQVVSTGPSSLVCAHADQGQWANCPSIVASHGFAADPGRRQWPEPCRTGLPRRASSPCCLPLVAGGRFHGLVVLDYGRAGTEHPTGRLVPLLTMANQLAIRLQAHSIGLAMGGGELGPMISDATEATPEPELELRCLGHFGVFRRGQPLSVEAFTRSKALVLLKLLALKAGAPINREVLIEHLWPEVDPRQGMNRLHGVIHDLRSVIEPRWAEREWVYVRSRGELYYLDVGAGVDLDFVRFRQLVTRGLRAGPDRPAEATAALTQAIELYRGDLFEDDPFADWCDAERQELQEAYVRAAEQLALIHQGQGASELALRCLQRALRSAPFREDLLVRKLKLLVELARPSEAAAVYEAYQRMLKKELGALPGPGLQALARHFCSPTTSARETTR